MLNAKTLKRIITENKVLSKKIKANKKLIAVLSTDKSKKKVVTKSKKATKQKSSQ